MDEKLAKSLLPNVDIKEVEELVELKPQEPENVSHKEVFGEQELTNAVLKEKNRQNKMNPEEHQKEWKTPAEEEAVEAHNNTTITMTLEDIPAMPTRGRDKKPRKKRVMTKKQLDHLSKIRRISARKRRENKEKRLAIARRVEEEMDRNKPVKKKAPFKEPTKPINIPTPTPIKQKQPKSEMNEMEKFFKMMNAYENMKATRKVRKKPPPQQQTRPQPHPNRRIPQHRTPVPPTDPTPRSIWSDCFR